MERYNRRPSGDHAAWVQEPEAGPTRRPAETWSLGTTRHRPKIPTIAHFNHSHPSAVR